MNPPQHAKVFCVDEKTAIQALERLDPALPLSPGRAERRGFEYDRHRTLSLSFRLGNQLRQKCDKLCAREIHIVLDSFSAQKTAGVEQFLADHPKVRFHITPTYSSCLNPVESWFSKLQRDVIDRGIFTSVTDLNRKILRYLRLYPKTAKPFQ